MLNQNNKFTEVEIKFPLLNPEDAIKKLNSIINPDLKNKYQKDVYFTPHHKDFTKKNPITEWLRIRNSEGEIYLNYKNWHSTKIHNAVSADEIETIVKDEEALTKIFRNLDFKHLITIEKKRSTWNHKDVEIAIDDVTDLGWYVELEAKGDFKDIEEAKQKLYNIKKEINIKVGPQVFKGYPHLMLIKKNLINEN